MRVWEDLGGSLRVWGILEASARIQEGLARTGMVVEGPGGAEWNWEVSEGDGRGIMAQDGLGGFGRVQEVPVWSGWLQ